MPSLRVIGPGRAGSAMALALADSGWSVEPALGRHDDLTTAAEGVDLLVIATPDAAVPGVARSVHPAAGTVVAHLAGSLGLGVLGGHPWRGAIHPLVALPSPGIGARRLAGGAWFAVAGDPPAAQAVLTGAVDALGGRWFTVADGDRATYHAAAAIASNHVVALLGQVERLASTAGVPFGAYLDLVRATIDNVAELGPRAALTGPAARGDWETVERHRRALPAEELDAYDAMVRAARRLVDDTAASRAAGPSGDEGG